MTRWMVAILLCLAGWVRAYEAPQIWALEGVSLAFTRAQIEVRWGRPLKVRWEGEHWEFSYGGCRVAHFSDQHPGRHALLLVGKTWTSRGQVMLGRGAGRGEAMKALGSPQFDVEPHWVYRDEDRKAFFTLHFDDQGQVDQFVVSRFRIDSQP